jgi:hypothetical protein
MLSNMKAHQKSLKQIDWIKTGKNKEKITLKNYEPRGCSLFI